MVKITRVRSKSAAKSGEESFSAKAVVTTGLTLALGLFFLPVIFSAVPLIQDGAEETQATLPIHRTPELPQSVVASRYDKGRAVRLARADGSVEQLTMDEYLWGVVAAEMPASFELEALKAQTVAARTYTVTKQSAGSSRHPDAELCDDSSCCQAYVERDTAVGRWGLSAQIYADKISRAVQETDGLGVLYNGSPIQAVFFSSAPGRTTDAVAVWGNAVDYLVGVDSPEGDEVPNYRSQVIFSPQEAKEAVQAAYPAADLSGGPETWLGDVVTGDSGRVTGMQFGDQALTGDQARAAFGLRSSTFQVKWDGTQFIFDVTGYGHGVGMSQYGANAMAKAGSGFQAILTWYYTGTQVDVLWDEESAGENPNEAGPPPAAVG